MNIGVVIVTYNRLELLKQCINAVTSSSIEFSRIIIVDNCSTDGTGDYLHTFAGEERYTIISKKHNSGGAGGFYDGMKRAMDYNLDWVLIIDDDAMIHKNYMRRLLAYAKKNPGTVAMAGSVYVDGKIHTMHRRKVISKLLFIEKEIPQSEYQKQAFRCDTATFCGLVVRGDILRRAGLPKKEYFIWYDDSEYTIRLHRYDKRGIVVIPEAKLDHKTTLPQESEGLLERTSWRHYYGYRNRMDTARIHYGWLSSRCVGMEYHILLFKSYLMGLDKNKKVAMRGRYNQKMIKDAMKDARRKKFGKNPNYLPGTDAILSSPKENQEMDIQTSRKIMAVVVTYQRKELLQECLQALQLQMIHSPQTTLEILVVDNHSKDGTMEWLLDYCRDKDLCYKTHVLTLSANVGGAGGFSKGIENAILEYQADDVWMMDDDTIVQTDSLQQLLDARERLDSPYGFLSSDVRWIDGSECRMNLQHEIKESFEERLRHQKWTQYQGMVRVDQATFVSVFVPENIIYELGLPKKEYFIWGDDVEFTHRLAKEYPCYKVNDSKVIHKMKINAGSNIALDDIKRVDRYFYAYRNDLATARERGIQYVMIYMAGAVLNAYRIVRTKERGKRVRMKTLFRGFGAGLTFSPAIQYLQKDE